MRNCDNSSQSHLHQACLALGQGIAPLPSLYMNRSLLIAGSSAGKILHWPVLRSSSGNAGVEHEDARLIGVGKESVCDLWCHTSLILDVPPRDMNPMSLGASVGLMPLQTSIVSLAGFIGTWLKPKIIAWQHYARLCLAWTQIAQTQEWDFRPCLAQTSPMLWPLLTKMSYRKAHLSAVVISTI